MICIDLPYHDRSEILVAVENIDNMCSQSMFDHYLIAFSWGDAPATNTCKWKLDGNKKTSRILIRHVFLSGLRCARKKDPSAKGSTDVTWAAGFANEISRDVCHQSWGKIRSISGVILGGFWIMNLFSSLGSNKTYP